MFASSLRLRTAAAVALLAAIATPVAAEGGDATGSARATVTECAGLLDRRLEVCTAYIANATLAARLPYYKFARSDNAAQARLARYRLESRYVGRARAKIVGQVSRWPRGRPNVDLPRVKITSARVSENRATLVTKETWKVRASSGRVLFSEKQRRHTITMQRVEGLVLHKWVVAAIAG